MAWEDYDMTLEQAAAPKKFAKAQEKCTPVYVRKEQRQGWSAKLPIYVLWCAACAMFSMTHPAGYGRIACQKCRQSHRVMTWERFRDKHWPVYYRLGIAVSVIVSIVGLMVWAVRAGW